MSGNGAVHTWTFLQSLRCPRVINAEGYVYCMVCDKERAVGHVEIKGGEYDGRLVLLTCESCGRPENEAHAFAVLDLQVVYGYLDVRTGGPGPEGSAPMRHDDHVDTLDDWREEHDA